ncbi:uncharacterized protein LOC116416806 [Nasonia vitripennis]|uniref:Uncharacterized protein n=1 Tax=Nasonia vitripennis TaxID=7425 RepID=A0A7M7Q8H6_NASVI|nr:uncharacterized protein LOC116416806 [Nasonia vitripennis]
MFRYKRMREKPRIHQFIRDINMKFALFLAISAVLLVASALAKHHGPPGPPSGPHGPPTLSTGSSDSESGSSKQSSNSSSVGRNARSVFQPLDHLRPPQSTPSTSE